MLDPQITMKHVWEAFSTLSDAQELISMELATKAIETINHAKNHLNEIFQQDQNLLKRVVLESTLGCELENLTTTE